LPEVLRGNPDRTEALIDASRHQWTYRAGVISFAATDTTTEEQQAEVKHVLPVKGCSDITYIPVKNGFLYLVAIMDWATRKILTWRLSNTLDVSFCVEALEEAIALYGKPEIMNTDQGRQYTGAGWITTLTNADIKISMPLGRLLCNRLPGNGRLPSKTDHRYLDWILQLITPSHGP
jgi:transposase InsO family protein